MFVDPKTVISQFGVTPGQNIADLGSGAGFYSLALAHEVGGKGKVYAVDIQEDLLKQLKTAGEQENLDNIEIIRGDLEEEKGTKLADKSVDGVVIANTLFQLEKPEICVKEAMRIVAPEGKMLVVDWRESFGGLGPQEEHVIPEERAKKMFEDAGCEVIEDINTKKYHYGFVCKVKA
jgi:ubiquinone/menaquinone biosynthesis C-methylase UbiE